MSNEERLIDANKLESKLQEHRDFFVDGVGGFRFLSPKDKARVDEITNCIAEVCNAPTVDAVPVDEIRVNFRSLCLYNQEAILDVSICGKPNEVKLPFSKEVAEVVHGRWKYYHKQNIAVCTNCSFERNLDDNFGAAIACPNCGAKMDGGTI